MSQPKAIPAEDAAVSITARAVATVLPFAAVKDIRWYLRGVAVIPVDEGVVAVATDGTALLAARDREGHADHPVILPINKREHARHLAGGDFVRVTPEGRTFIVDAGGAPSYISPAPLIEGKFPDVHDLLGSLEGWHAGCPDAALALGQLQRVQATAAKTAPVRMYHRGDSAGAVLFTIGQDLYGLVMPLRDIDSRAALEATIPTPATQEPPPPEPPCGTTEQADAQAVPA
ncbi:hypothetical protein BGP89_11240 [Luteimonas sp. JM171]|uniref:hypothetical protein n=1 Tax=Luteimonas sp. JM171 TaxID=1896164 RepID=UPI000856BD67|nr:hypothetical protein [Luteimonas sp. JM171]AOH36855.1 hypothetical protein BGP89_11240 [Luteimonas sp. JM171]